MAKTKVLYVEDETFLGKIVKESLESRGFQVFMESDGNRAIEAFGKSQPDVCVLDVMLPGKDGFAVADEIRIKNEDVPIIFLTAKTQTEDVVRGFTVGGNDSFINSRNLDVYIARLRGYLKDDESLEIITIKGIGYRFIAGY